MDEGVGFASHGRDDLKEVYDTSGVWRLRVGMVFGGKRIEMRVMIKIFSDRLLQQYISMMIMLLIQTFMNTIAHFLAIMHAMI